MEPEPSRTWETSQPAHPHDEAGASRPLTRAQVESWQERGCALVSGLLTDAEVDAACAAAKVPYPPDQLYPLRRSFGGGGGETEARPPAVRKLAPLPCHAPPFTLASSPPSHPLRLDAVPDALESTERRVPVRAPHQRGSAVSGVPAGGHQARPESTRFSNGFFLSM